jgi:hypothetical protein
MASNVSLDGIKKTVFFPFSGKNWLGKIAIGSAINLANYILPILPIIPIFGYSGEIAKRVICEDEDPQMPDWKDWGRFFSEGIKLFGVSALYSLPGALTMVAGYLLMMAGNFTFLIDPEFFSSPTSVGTDFFLASMAGMMVGVIILLFGMLLLVVAGLFLPPALGHSIAKGEFNAAFRIKEWWPIFKANFSGFLLTMVVEYGINMGMIWVVYIFYFSVVLCILMPVALVTATFLINVLHFSLISVAYRDGVRKLSTLE